MTVQYINKHFILSYLNSSRECGTNVKSKMENPNQFTSPVQHQVDDLFSNGVVSTSIIIGSILFASDELLRMEELTICPSPYFICT